MWRSVDSFAGCVKTLADFLEAATQRSCYRSTGGDFVFWAARHPSNVDRKSVSDQRGVAMLGRKSYTREELALLDEQ
jgi:hypothetical protein